MRPDTLLDTFRSALSSATTLAHQVFTGNLRGHLVQPPTPAKLFFNILDDVCAECNVGESWSELDPMDAAPWKWGNNNNESMARVK